MKNSLFTLVLISFLTGTLFAACQSPVQLEAITPTVLSAPAPDYTSALADAPKYQKAESEEWKAFRTTADAKIRSNEMILAELSVKFQKPGTALDTLYVNRIRALTRQNLTFNSSLDTFEKNQANLETFKRDFNHEMDEFDKELKKLTAVTNK